MKGFSSKKKHPLRGVSKEMKGIEQRSQPYTTAIQRNEHIRYIYICIFSIALE